MMIASVGVTSLLFGTIICVVVEVEGSIAWEWGRDNFPPINRYSRSKAPHAGVRRSIFERFWGDSTPNNPFLFSIPSVPRILPRLSENDFVNDDDYQEDRSDFHWFPQRQHSNQPTKSLEGLEHILEGKLGPINDPPPIAHRQSSQVPSHKEEEKEKKQKNKQRKHRQRINHEMNHEMIPSSSSSSSDERTGNLRHHLPNFGTEPFANEGQILNHDHFSKDILHDFQEELSMPEHFTNPKQFPKDFISPEQFPREFGLAEPSPRDHLTTDPFASELQDVHGSFQDHLLLNPLPNSDFQNPDQIINLDTDQTLSEVGLPQMFPNLGILGKIGKPEGFIPQERLGHFGLQNPNSHDISEIPDIIPERGEGLEWLPPSLSDLNLPSHGHMFSKEAHRGTRTIRSSSVSGPDACHARNLHSCGSRLIDEFAFRPENSEKCRIREEFLDCMEKVMKLPCELHGERYSREGTKLIRDKIKTLLWSAQGCILGYST